MSDIKVGDLVVVVRWSPCGCGLGHVGIFLGHGKHRLRDGCGICKIKGDKFIADIPQAAFLDPPFRVPLSWLKRIPPLDELNDVKQDEEIHA